MKMADSSEEGAGFWLPSEFFDDFLTDNNNVAESDPDFCFPAEFPYETQKRCLMSTSPQSTMVHAGSWSGRSSGGSSDATKDAVEDLIHHAAGQVSKMRLHGSGATRPVKNTDHLRPAAKNPNHFVFQNVYLQHHQRIGKQQQQKPSGGIWYSEPQMHEMGPDPWPVHQNPTRIVGSGHEAVLLGGSVGGGGAAVKRKSAGTGVFLPRRFGNINDCNAYSDSPQKPGYSAAFVPEHNVYVLNKNVDYINGYFHSRSHFTRRLNPDHDLLMAQRNALMFATSAKFANRMLVSDHEPWLVPSSRADIGSFPVL